MTRPKTTPRPKISGSTPDLWRLDPRRSQNTTNDLLIKIENHFMINFPKDSNPLSNLDLEDLIRMIGWTDTLTGSLRKIRRDHGIPTTHTPTPTD